MCRLASSQMANLQRRLESRLAGKNARPTKTPGDGRLVFGRAQNPIHSITNNKSRASTASRVLTQISFIVPLTGA